ncbi:MAG: DUF4261 domain-containing protein [Planctomycetes bacterium]|nr:DUF4261 domain-containing protein [Planctomycetota bacterium]
MGLFDWLKGSKEAPQTGAAPGMIVLLDGMPQFDAQAATKALDAIEELRAPSKIEIENAPVGGKTAEGDEVEGALHGSAEFDSHSIGIVGFDAPAPGQVMEKTVKVSNWTGEAREQLENHYAHLVLMHAGGGASTLEKYIALYKLAAVLGGGHLRGVVIEDAWTCAPADLVREFTNPDMLKAFRESIPPILFSGFVRFTTDEGAWFVTKGHHLFNAPDLAMEGAEEKPSEVMDLFMNIFLYVAGQKAQIAPGHTLQIAEEAFLKFSEIAPDNPWKDWLLGAGQTLQLRRISKDEINRKGGA